MPFGSPTPTQADLHFQLFGFPIRIHPFFWLVCILLGPKEPKQVLLWAIAMLVSIIVHELGHAFVQRAYGGRSHIVLYGFGGLAISEGVRITPWRQVLISLAGPFAGFALAGILWGIAQAWAAPPELARYLISYLLLINIFWGVFNLLPIYPLDGGHVSREICTMVLSPHRGIVASLWLSIFCCALAGFWLWNQTPSLWNTVLIGSLAYNNYQTLQGYQNSYGNRY